MTRRLTIMTAIAFLIGIIVFFPLRLALGGIDHHGLTARQVAGTIWYGRIGELMLRRVRLGTFEARIEPLQLLTGKVAVGFRRMDDPDGSLTGVLRTSGTQGLERASGRIAAAGLFGDLPVTSLQLDDATLLFRDGQCVEASGRMTIGVAAPLPGLGGGFTGSPSCEGDRVRAVLGGPVGAALEFYVQSDGRYRAWLRARADSADVQDALLAAGFRQSEGGMVLVSEGRL